MNNVITIVLLLVLVGSGAWLWYRYGGKKTAAPLAAATHMAKTGDVKTTAKEKHRDTPGSGIALGRLLDEKGNAGRWLMAQTGTTGIVVGPTGSGKTQTIVLPVILKHDGPLLATSTKDELASDGYFACRSRGVVQVLDPAGVSLRGTDSRVAESVAVWTPIQSCSTYDAASKTVEQLVSAGGGEQDGKAALWTNSTKSLLTSVFWLMRQYPSTALSDVARLLTALQSDGTDLEADTEPELPGTFEDVVMWLTTHPASGWEAAGLLCQELSRDGVSILDAQRASDGFEGMRQIADAKETVAGVVFGVQGELRKLVNAEAVWFSAWDDDGLIDLEAWASEPSSSLFVIAPDDSAPYLGYFCSFITAAVSALDAETWKHDERKLPSEALLVLDELANICPLPQLPRWLATKRSQNIRFILGLQGLNQLQAWGETDAATIINNANRFLMVLPGTQDDKTTDHVCKYAGERVEELETTSTSKTTGDSKGKGKNDSDSYSTSKSVNKNVSASYRPLATPSGLFQMAENQAAVLIPRQPFALVQTVRAYEDKRLSQLMSMETPVGAPVRRRKKKIVGRPAKVEQPTQQAEVFDDGEIEAEFFAEPGTGA